MANNTKIDNLNCECLRPDVEIQGDCTPPVIDVNTPDLDISYNDLTNKPSINEHILKGDQTGDDLGLVDKTTEPNQVYATDDEGKPTTIPYSEEADAEYIVRRDENGDVIVPLEPGKDEAATSKKYVDDAIDEILTKAVVFKGVLDNQTELPTEGNRNGDMYWIKEFVEPVPPGMLAGHTGTAIYNGTLQEWQFEKDEVYDPDLQTIIFNRAGQLAVQLSQEEYNNIEIKEDGLYLSLHGIEEDLAEEIARATQAESDLNDKIDEETQNREDADQDLSDRIDQEIEDREQADSDLADDYNSKIGELSELETDNQDNLVSAINEVKGNLDNEIQDRIDADDGLSDRIDQEAQDRQDADTSLEDDYNSKIGNLSELTDPANNLVAAINTLSSALTDEAEARSDADDALGDRIDQEAQEREDADSGLSDRIDAEEEVRTDADNDLSDRIDAEAERAESVEGDLSNLTTSEKSNLVGAINELDSNKVDANAAITGATHTKITYDSKGLVTGGSDITLSDVTDITATASEVNQLHSSGIETADLTKLHNVTADANELNILDGATLTTTELNYVDGVTSSIQGQIGDLSSLTTDAKTSLQAAINEVDSHTDTNTTDITTINSKIPEQASSSNQLADKEFVNSSIATNTGNFIGTFQSIADRDAYQGTLTNNDYCFVVETDQIGNTVYNRYKWSTATTPAAWQFEYALNNSSFTADQWAAINSNITSAGTTQITTNKNAIGTLSNLTTTEKTNLVGAINELDSCKVEANASITGATHTKITYDSKGLVTGGSDIVLTDVTDITATAAEVNVLHSSSVTTADLTKLHNVTADATELNYVDGVTSSIQTQLDSKQATITGAATTITSSDLTTNRALISNGSGKVAVSSVTDTELGYVSGVTSAIQTQLDSKSVGLTIKTWSA